MSTWAALHKQFPGQIQEPRIEHLAGYARRMVMYQGNATLTHDHKTDHYSILESGNALVWTGNDCKEYNAPAVVIMKAGVSHRIEALTEIVWLCVHTFPLGTEMADILADEIDKVTVRS